MNPGYPPPPGYGYPNSNPAGAGLGHPAFAPYNPAQVATPAPPAQYVPYNMFAPEALSVPQIEADVLKLHKAFKGLGTDEAAVISVLGKRTPSQMEQISLGYTSQYGKSLVTSLESEVSGNFLKLCVALATPLPQFEASCLHDAIAGLGTNEKTINEILIGRSDYDIHRLKQAYAKMFDQSLEDAISGDTSGDLKRTYLGLLQGTRDGMALNVDPRQDAETLYKAGEGRLGTDESKFVAIFSTRPFAHLYHVIQAYQQKYGKTFESAIQSEFSGQVERLFLDLTRIIVSRYDFIADLFHSAMAGLGTDDKQLVRLATRYRHPNDMHHIKAAYSRKFGKTLAQAVTSETSGDYKKLLLAIVE